MKDKIPITEVTKINVRWNKLQEIINKCIGVIPCVVQNAKTGEVLLIAYVNKEALKHSIETGLATFWSTSRNELWVKGLTSGNVLKLIQIRVNCEMNSLLYLVETTDSVCHTVNKKGEYRKSCFYRAIKGDSLIFARSTCKKQKRKK